MKRVRTLLQLTTVVLAAFGATDAPAQEPPPPPPPPPEPPPPPPPPPPPAPSVRKTRLEVEGVHQDIFRLIKGFAYTFSGEPVLPSMDVELDVFGYPGGEFLARHRNSDPGTEIPAAAIDRNVTVIVRGQPGTQAGPVKLRIVARKGGLVWGDQEQTVQVEPVSTDRHPTVPFTVQGGAHVMTVQEMGGPEDTVLMVYPAPGDHIPAPPMQLDDDNGVGAMSWMHLALPCGAGSQFGCAVVVGRRTNPLFHTSPIKQARPPAGTATLVVDDKVHLADADLDGLSDELEIQVGSQPLVKDTDGDGLIDSFEIIGKDNPQHTLTSALKFPLYGASVTQKDLFIEASWKSPCDPASPICNPGAFRPDAKFADDLAAIFAAMEIRVHLDNGLARSDNTNSGDWGGAGMVRPWNRDFGEDPTYCEARSTNDRKSHFFQIITGMGAQNATHPCSAVPLAPSTAAHEISHGFGLGHGGTNALGHDNCKPNYFSLMNYATQQMGKFSRGLRPPLNPLSVEEAVGIGGPDTPFVEIANFYGREFLDNGGIDWNMDGLVSGPGHFTRAWLNHAGTTDCDKGAPTRRETSQFMLGTPGVVTDEGGVPVVHNVTSHPFFATAIVRVNADLSRCAQATTNVDVPCARFTNGSVVSPSRMILSPVFSPAAVSGLVVAADHSGRLHAFHPGQGGRPTAVVRLGPPAVTGDPVAVEHEDIVSIYAPVGTAVRRWDFDRRWGAWVTQGAHVGWETLEPVSTRNGIGATVGFQMDEPSRAIYAAVKAPAPVTEAGVVVTPIDVGRVIRTVTRVQLPWGPGPAMVSEAWRRVPTLQTSVPNDWTNDGQRLSLAYVPFEEAPETLGRFYLSHRDKDGNQVLAVTRGNRPPAFEGDKIHVLRWVTPALINNRFTKNKLGRLSMAVVAGQLRAVGQSPPTGPGAVSFFPNFDGVYNHIQTDHDDFTRLLSRFACTLRANCPNN